MRWGSTSGGAGCWWLAVSHEVAVKAWLGRQQPMSWLEDPRQRAPSQTSPWAAWVSSQRGSWLPWEQVIQRRAMWRHSVPRDLALEVPRCFSHKSYHLFCRGLYNVGADYTRTRESGGGNLWGPCQKLATTVRWQVVAIHCKFGDNLLRSNM